MAAWLEYGSIFVTTAFVLYGDGVADIDISALVAHHIQSARMATLTAVQPPGRYGVVELERDQVKFFMKNLKVTILGLRLLCSESCSNRPN